MTRVHMCRSRSPGMSGSTTTFTRGSSARIAASCSLPSWKVAMPTWDSESAAAAENSAENLASSPVRGFEWIRIRGHDCVYAHRDLGHVLGTDPVRPPQLEGAVDDGVRAGARGIGLDGDARGQDLPRRPERVERPRRASPPHRRRERSPAGPRAPAPRRSSPRAREARRARRCARRGRRETAWSWCRSFP